MTTMFDIGETVNPILTIFPIILMTFSGYTFGKLLSQINRTYSGFLKELIYGNLALSLIFISGFILFGVLVYSANSFFTFFTLLLIGLTIIGIFNLLKKLRTIESKQFRNYFSKSNFYSLLMDSQSILLLLGISLFVILLVYHGIIIYHHSILGEIDSIYLFLPISKSIILGDGLDHDFYLGDDINMRYPPYTQALNAWLIHSFTYSSLKLFPIYFVFLTALVIYFIAKSVTRNKILGLVSALIFLITPSLLFTSAKYSLQEDLAFMFFLASSFYFLVEIVRFNKIEKIHILFLSLSLTILPLSREIGLIISISLFFLFPAIKFTKDQPKLRGILTVFSLAPLYGLSFYDMLRHGFTDTIVIRLLVVVVVNVAIFYLSSQVRNQNSITALIKGNFIYFVFPMCIPIIFVLINLITINGPYSVFALSNEFETYTSSFRDLIGKPTEIFYDIGQALKSIPQIQLLFITTQMGSVFLLFKLRAYLILINELKKNPQYTVILILTCLFLVIWSYLLGSGIDDQSNRHLLYILPIMSVITVIGMKKREGTFHELYYFGIIVFVTFYFLVFKLNPYNYNDETIFYSFVIKNSIMDLFDLIVSILLFIPLLIVGVPSVRKKLIKHKMMGTQRTLIIISIGLIISQLLIMSNTGMGVVPIQQSDLTFPPFWEGDVIEVIDYLNHKNDSNNVFGIYTPSIPFFTNRTLYDIYYPATIRALSPLLMTNDPGTLEQKINELNIRYIVIPNEDNTILHNYTQKILDNYFILQTMKVDPNFVRTKLPLFDIYEYIG